MVYQPGLAFPMSYAGATQCFAGLRLPAQWPVLVLFGERDCFSCSMRCGAAAIADAVSEDAVSSREVGGTGAVIVDVVSGDVVSSREVGGTGAAIADVVSEDAVSSRKVDGTGAAIADFVSEDVRLSRRRVWRNDVWLWFLTS